MADNSAPALVVETEPDLGSVHLLEEWLYEYSVEATGIADGKLFSVFLRDPDGAVIGGTHGWTWAGRCYVRLLYIPSNLRNQGYGSRLMQVVEQEARQRGCHEIVLHTHDFQAPEFYQKFGFKLNGAEEFPRGHQFFKMVKTLRPSVEPRTKVRAEAPGADR